MKSLLIFMISINCAMELPLSQKKFINELPIEYHSSVRSFAVFETKKAGLLYSAWFLKYASKQLSLELPSEIVDKIVDDYFPLFFYKFASNESIPDISFEYWQLDHNMQALISSQGAIRSLLKNSLLVFTDIFWMCDDGDNEQEFGYLDNVNNCVVRKNNNTQKLIFYMLPELCKEEYFNKLAFSFDKKTVYLVKNDNEKLNFFPFFINCFLLCGKTLSIQYKKNSDLWKEKRWQSL